MDILIDFRYTTVSSHLFRLLSKREALQYERDFLARLSGNLDMTFADFVKVYLQDRTPRIKDSTADTKRNIIETKILTSPKCIITNYCLLLFLRWGVSEKATSVKGKTATENITVMRYTNASLFLFP